MECWNELRPSLRDSGLWLEALMLAVELQGYDRNCHMGVNGLLAAPSNRPP